MIEQFGKAARKTLCVFYCLRNTGIVEFSEFIWSNCFCVMSALWNFTADLYRGGNQLLAYRNILRVASDPHKSITPAKSWLTERSPCGSATVWETGRNDMTLTRELLDTRYAWWFHNKRNAEQAKREILIIFSKELDDCFEWTEQDIYEQSRKIIFRWDNA